MRRGLKPLLSLPFAAGPRTALEASALLYRTLGVRRILVVSGLHKEEVAREARRLGLEHEHNPHAASGMFSSLRAGLNALGSSCVRCFVHPADIPLVRPLTPAALLAQAPQEPEAALIPVYRGEEGHPPLLPAALFPAILRAGEEGGLRAVLRSLPRRLVAVPDANILADMDTDADYEDACRRAERAHLLEAEEAEELLRLRGIGERGAAHARAVAAVAEAFASALNAAGSALPLDPRLARAGGLLHDLCKGQARHEHAAGEALRALHLPEIARLAEAHRDCAPAGNNAVTEKELVYLADKYVHGDRLVTIRERFGQKLKLFSSDAEACAAVRDRLNRALSLEQRFSREIGREAFALAHAALERIHA